MLLLDKHKKILDKAIWKDPLMVWTATNYETLKVRRRLFSHQSGADWRRLMNGFFEFRYQHHLILPTGVSDEDVVTRLDETLDHVKKVFDNAVAFGVYNREIAYPAAVGRTFAKWVFYTRDRLEAFYAKHYTTDPQSPRALWLELENNNVHLPPVVTFDYAFANAPYILWRYAKDLPVHAARATAEEVGVVPTTTEVVGTTTTTAEGVDMTQTAAETQFDKKAA